MNILNQLQIHELERVALTNQDVQLVYDPQITNIGFREAYTYRFDIQLAVYGVAKPEALNGVAQQAKQHLTHVIYGEILSDLIGLSWSIRNLERFNNDPESVNGRLTSLIKKLQGNS